MAWACRAASGTGRQLVFIADGTQDRTSWMNSEVFRDVLSAQIQPNAVKLIGWCITIQTDNDPRETAKAAQFIKAKKWNIVKCHIVIAYKELSIDFRNKHFIFSYCILICPFT